jgi:hypothetical protein
VVQQPASTTDCVTGTIELLGEKQSPTQENIRFAKEHCYSLIRSQSLLNNFYILDLNCVQQYRANTVLMWTVVAVTLSDVILATLQLLASYNRAASKSTSLDASTEMLEEQYVVNNEKPYLVFCENPRR